MIFKNTASQKAIYFAFDATTNAPKTGDAANITPYVSKDYGAVTAITDTSATEMDSTNAPGYYLVDLTQGETNAEVLLLSAKSSTANVKVIGAPAVIFTMPTTGVLSPATVGRTLNVDASGRALADVDTIKTNPVVNAGTVTFPTGATLASTTNITAGTVTTATNVTTVNGLAANVITAASIAADAGAEVASAVRTELTTELGRIDAAVTTRLAPTTAGRTLDVSAGGEAGIDFANIGSPTTVVNLSGTTIKTATDVETDTADIQTRIPATLTGAGNIKADALAFGGATVTATTSVTIPASSTLATTTGAVGSVTGNVGGNVTGSVGSLAAQAKTDVNTEVVDCLNVDTYAEPTGAPAATSTLRAKIGWIFKLMRNKRTQTSTTETLYADDATTADATSAKSDDGTTATRGEWT